MNPYYLVMPRDGFGTAAPIDQATDQAATELERRLGEPGTITGCRQLTWIRTDDRPAPNWQWGLGYVPLLSTSFRDILDTHKSRQDAIQWLPATLALTDGSIQERWIPHFTVQHDVLDTAATTWGPSGLPLLWFLDPTKLDGLNILMIPGMTGDLIVNAETMRALRRAKMTGHQVLRARLTHATPHEPPTQN
ncbi:MAG: hypothetical protein VB080_09420 [Propionicimonas sp.]|uniref:hypothetical protein n=1 Tax=Propionicimonas sp. TaxID=1955623 RepID=UPI002B2177CE|nr:hypothetical protein [Propionicimonas sp.]MEA4944640.1 hypothetical protein [Propionicimonas sp.]MEA5053967.1 hypothetical protein [Propionicimonas sp.]MEA5117505.1 hypothetical protein [Propionicimonas sp.]